MKWLNKLLFFLGWGDTVSPDLSHRPLELHNGYQLSLEIYKYTFPINLVFIRLLTGPETVIYLCCPWPW